MPRRGKHCTRVSQVCRRRAGSVCPQTVLGTYLRAGHLRLDPSAAILQQARHRSLSQLRGFLIPLERGPYHGEHAHAHYSTALRARSLGIAAYITSSVADPAHARQFPAPAIHDPQSQLTHGQENPASTSSTASQLQAIESTARSLGPRVDHDPMGQRFAGGKIISGATQHRLILFSFDDGPDRRTTPLLLDRLDAEGVRALFFLTASRMAGTNKAERQQQAIARQIAARGHLVGNHTMNHPQLPLLSNDEVLNQIQLAEQVFEDVFGAHPALIRPPGGATSPRVNRVLASAGYTTVLWNLGAGDFQVRSAAEVVNTWREVFARREREQGERGGIILLHDTHDWSVDAFQMIIAELKDRNCELLAQGEELFDIVDDPTWFFEPRSANGNDIAAPAAPPPGLLAARQALLRDRTSKRCSRL